jgi:hypothetical protein
VATGKPICGEGGRLTGGVWNSGGEEGRRAEEEWVVIKEERF